MRLKPEQLEKFKRIAKDWGQMDMEVGSRLVDFLALLDHDAQQLVLGLPMDDAAARAAADKIGKAILAGRKAKP